MRLAICFVIATTLFLAARQIVCADESDGVVDKVQGSDISIKPEFHFIPEIGDKIEILSKSANVGETKVGTAVVTGIDDDRVRAQVRKATHNVEPGQIVRALSVALASQPPAPPVPPSERDFVIIKSPAARVMSGSEEVGQVRSGQRLPFTQTNGDWYLIEVQQDGRMVRGWVHRDHVRTESDSGVPSPDEVIAIEGWGTLVDPDGGAKIVEKDGAVELTVPGVCRDLYTKGKVNAPRILSSIKGDFAVQVKVTSPVDVTGHDVARDAEFPYRAAVLLVWMDQTTFVRLERASSATRPHRADYQTYEQKERATTQTTIVRPEKVCWLRIQRKQGTFYAWFRQQGDTKWTAMEVLRPRIADEVQVGVSLVNTTNQPFTVRFEDFVVERN